MSETAVVQPSAVHPFHEPSRRRRLIKVGAWLVGIALAIVVLNLLGVDVIGWLQDLWDQIKAVPTQYMVGGPCLPDRPDPLRRALVLRHPARGLSGPG